MTDPANAADQPAPPAPASLEIAWLPGTYAVCRLDSAAAIPGWASPQPQAADLISITRTSDELSIVAPDHAIPDDVPTEPGWAACRIVGTLDFSMVGILARLTGALAGAGISVFAISTFDTDYLMVKQTDQPKAAQTLSALEIPAR